MTAQSKTKKAASSQNGTGPSFASVDDILAADDLGEDVVDVSEWGVKVKVRGISRAEFRAVETKATTEASGDIDADMADAWLMHFGMVDPSVTYEQAEEILRTKSISSCQKITAAIMEASGLGDNFRP